MLHLFKKLEILYWVLFILGVLAFAYEAHYLIPSIFIINFILLVFYLACLAKIFGNISKKLYINICNIYIDECDPLRFVETINRKTNINHVRQSDIYIAVKLSICLAYIDANRLDEAKKIMDHISCFSNNKNGLSNKSLYYGVLFTYCLRTNDLAGAENIFHEMMEFKKCHLYKKEESKYEMNYTNNLNKLKIKEGNYEGLEQYYRNQYREEDPMLYKVSTQYTLGKVYINCDKINEAKKAFEYVIRNGNKLFLVKESEKYLEKLS